MDDPGKSLIETAVRPLAGQGEVHLAAIEMLAPLVKANGRGGEPAKRRWDEVDAAKGPSRWKIALYIVTALVSAVILADGARRLVNFRAAAQAVDFAASGYLAGIPDTPRSAGKPDLTAEQRLILEGDPSQRSRAARAKALWDHEPANPAYFLNHAQEYLSENSKLPPDFLKTAREIDPGNSWYFYLAAAVEGKDCVKRRSQSAKEKADKAPNSYDVLDAKKLETAIALIHEGRDLPRCENYKAELLGKRIPLLDQSDPFKRLASATYLFAMTSSDVIAMRRLGEIIEAKAASIPVENNPPAFQSLVMDWDAMVRKTLDVEPVSLVEGLVTSVNIMASRGLAARAGTLGLDEESHRLGEIDKRITERLETRKRLRPAVLVNGAGFSRKSALFPGMTVPMTGGMVLTPPPVSEADVKPGRLTDHSYLTVLAATAAFGLLAVHAGVLWAYCRFQREVVRKLAARFESLLMPGDCASILVAGVFIPFGYTLGIYLLTPLGGRDLSLKSTLFLLPSAQFLGMVFLIIIVSLLVADQRLRKRATGFNFGIARPGFGWVAVVATVVAIPLIGGSLVIGMEDGIFCAAGLMALAPLWLLWMGFLAFFGKGCRSLHFTAVARTAWPAFALAMLLMVSLVPVFRATALHWFKQDSFMSLDPAFPSGSRYEYQTVLQLRKELREVMGGSNSQGR